VILRAASALALLAGAAILFGYLHWVGKTPFSTPEERHLRAMKDRVQAPDSIAPITFADFMALPYARPLAEYAALERRGVSLDGYVHVIGPSSDGDLYLYVTQESHPRWSDVPRATTELTPSWRRGSRAWRFESLAATLRSHTRFSPPWPQAQRRARISGWLLYDFQYEPRDTRARRGIKPSPILATGWEIHPVTRIEVWDDATGRFTEVPR
jgi:hypothetical protein